MNHPNIITIHEIGRSQSLHYLVTEFVDGETLRQRLAKGPMQVQAVMEVGLSVASALAAAHEAGIVHRDIKPENIMIRRRDALVKVLDFGLAKLTETEAQQPVDASAPTKLPAAKTEPGAVIGTAQYMSPEQARGQKVDARSDIFSFGAVLYEMVTGQRAFQRASVAETLAAVLHQEPNPLPATVPPDLAKIILRCLRKDPARRFQTMRDLAIDLGKVRREGEAGRSAGADNEQTVTSGAAAEVSHPVRRQSLLTSWWALSLAAVMLLVIAGLGYWLLWRGAPTTVTPEIKSLAVLPLENLSGDPAQEYFADGMTEALISHLARIRALKVISRTSVMRYKGSRKSLPEIARELNVDAVIEGSVQRSGGRVRVTAQLIHAATDAHVWTSEYERDLTDVLKLQSEVARTVAAEVRIQVTAEERAQLAAARSVNPQAHEAYLLGRYHLSKNNEQDWQQAIAYFERATQIAPDYAAAYAGLSDVWVQRGVFGVKPFPEVERLARAAALQALKLNEQLAEAHTALANLKFYYDWDWTGAEAEFKRALELDPGGLEVHRSYGHLLMALGRHDEAVREGHIAAQLDPLSAETQTALGRFLYRARRYEEALPHLQLAVEREPRSIGANVRLADVYLQLRRYDEALAVFERGRQLTGDTSNFQAHIARVYALMGRKNEARQMIRGLKVAPIVMAEVYTALGDKDEAFRILARAIEERNSFLVALKEDPTFDSLHSDPRWQELLRRMNFPPE